MLSTNLKNLRKKRGISQKQLAKLTGLSYSYIQKIELGHKIKPSIEAMLKLCDALNISFSNLVADDDDFVNLADKIDEIDEIHPNNFYTELFSQIQNSTSLTELLEILFKHNDYLNNKLEKSIPSIEDQKYFFNTFAKYIDSYLKSEELRNMPWIDGDNNG